MAHSHLDPESDAYRSTLSPDLDERRHGALLSMLAAAGISDPQEPMAICPCCRYTVPAGEMAGELCTVCDAIDENEHAYEAAIERAERDRDER